MTDPVKAAYAKGYAAGKRRKQKDISNERRERERKAFLDRVFIAVLPTAMRVEGWTIGSEKVIDSNQRIKLARIWAKKAADERFRLHYRTD